MKMYRLIIFILLTTPFSLLAQPGSSVKTGTILPARDVPLHDPVMIKQNGTFYLFSTGNGISVWSSPDLKNWQMQAPVFSTPPQWAVDTIPGFKGSIWAPDISFHNGEYYLYYAVSVFGKNRSAIGVATNKTLNEASPDFKWQDHGPVIQSFPGKTNWNAIDPNLVRGKNGDSYLVFGSFWDGIKLVKLTSDLFYPAQSPDNLPTLANRKKVAVDSNGNKVRTGANAIEAPYIFKKAGYYYLFASIDYCCRGENSTYKVIIGRSKKIDGPYVDREGKDLLFGGGTILLQGNKAWYGVGHNGIFSSDGIDFIVYHGYDASDGGRSKLLMGEIKWKKGWPVVRSLPGK
jgi:arabinan endo-1,5-alpha-L-arabinosidase